jgi:DNA (cytosine-5)-methyltransferase 1
LVFCEIANAIDKVRSVRGLDQSIVFWENVPGVLSTKDNAFGCFLAGLAGEDNPLEPPGGKWTNAGYVLGPKRAVAWRVLDAQYFGVAQRRKRVFVVASARADFDPAAVLFEFDGVRRDIAPSRETGETIAPRVTNGPPFSRTGNERVEAEAMVVVAAADPAYCLETTCNDYSRADGFNMLAQPISIHPHCIGRAPEAGLQGKEYLLDGSAYCMDSRGQPQAIALQDVTPREKAQNGKGWNDDGTAYTVDTHATQGVAQPIDFRNLRFHDGDVAGTMQSKATGGYSLNYETGVMQPMVLMDQGGSVMNVEYDMVGTLRRETHGHEPAVIQPLSMAVRRLTPVECERLQGFPDGYTNIPWRKKDESPDGPRYKALGNSWAVPVVRWIGERIAKAA